MAGRRSDTALSTKTLKEKVGKGQLVRSELAEELSSLLLPLSVVSLLFLVFVLLIGRPVVHSDGAIYRGFRSERAP